MSPLANDMSLDDNKSMPKKNSIDTKRAVIRSKEILFFLFFGPKECKLPNKLVFVSKSKNNELFKNGNIMFFNQFFHFYIILVVMKKEGN